MESNCRASLSRENVYKLVPIENHINKQAWGRAKFDWGRGGGGGVAVR